MANTRDKQEIEERKERAVKELIPTAPSLPGYGLAVAEFLRLRP